MSRSAAKFTFGDDEVWYGLHCNTTDNYLPLIFKTKEERDELWGQWRDRHIGGKHTDDWDSCGCAGETVLVGPEYASESYLAKITGTACRVHGKYFGPYNDWPMEEKWAGWG